MVNRLETNFSSENEPERYVIPDEVQKWVDEYVAREKARDLGYDVWKALHQEFQKRSEENPEYQLAYLRYQYPDPDDPGGGMWQIENGLLREQRWKQKQAEIEKAEHTPVDPSLNILTNYEGTLEAMAKIEGQYWKEGQKSTGSGYTLADALKSMQKFTDREPDHIFEFYGDGGINRWFLRGDGSVELSAQHASEEDIVKAKLLGFKMAATCEFDPKVFTSYGLISFDL